MTTCSDTDSFRLEADIDYIYDDYDEVESPDGCYEEPVYDPVESGEAASEFYSNGIRSDYEYFFKAYGYEDGEVWGIATYVDGITNTRCIDYDQNDYTALHPTAVSYWACEDDDGGFSYTTLSATISTICGCDTPAPTAAPTTPPPTPAPTSGPATPDPTAAPATPLPTAPSAPAPSAASSTPAPAAAPGPTPDGLTPAPRTLMDTSSPTRASEIASSPPPVSTTSDEAPAGEVAGGVVAGVVVVVAVVLAALFKTGRLKIKRTGKQRKPSHDDVASGSGSTGNTPPAASEAPVRHQYPIAYQYPEAVE